MTVMLVLLNPNKPLLSKEKVSEEDRNFNLIKIRQDLKAYIKGTKSRGQSNDIFLSTADIFDLFKILGQTLCEGNDT